MRSGSSSSIRLFGCVGNFSIVPSVVVNKYRPNYPRQPFGSVEEARVWTLQFVRWYNQQHKHSGLKFVTPNERHNGTAQAILVHRKQVYQAAKKRHPERWSGETRNWVLKDEVWLNPERVQPEIVKQAA